MEGEATFIREKQKVEQQAKMLQIQGEVARAKARARVYEDYSHIQSRASTKDEEEPDEVIEEKYINRRQMLTTATEELDHRSCDQLATCDKTSEQKMKTVQRKPKVRIEDAEPTADRRGPKQTARNSEGNQEDMVGMMSKLIRQQAVPDVDIDICSSDPVDYHYFIAVFEEVDEKKIDDPRGRLARLIRDTDGKPKKMIKHCIQQPVSVDYKNARSLLEEKYGNPHYIVAAYRKEIKSWPQLKPAGGAAYRRFYNFLLKCESATYGQNWNTIDTPEMMCLVLSKLPGNSREKWNRTVLNIKRRHLREPDFADLIHFVDDEATLANDPLFSKDVLSGYVDQKEAPSKQWQLKTYLATAKENSGKSKEVCYLCQNNHDLDECQEYMKKSLEERSKFLFQKKLFYGCYMPISTDHNSWSCKQRRVCDTCGEKHPTGLHGYKGSKKKKDADGGNSQKSDSTLAYATTKLKSKFVSMCVAPVKVKCSNSKKESRTHAMLDCCSQGTFISTDLARKLKSEGVQTTIKIKTLNGKESQETEAVSGLKVSKSSGQRMWIDLPVTYMKEDLPVDDEDAATPEKIRKWKYLERIADEISQGQGISIGLLIGGNCSKALEPLEVIPSEQGGPYAFKTLLGWCIVGTIFETTFDTAVACNRISVQDKVSKNVASHYFARETEVQDIKEDIYIIV